MELVFIVLLVYIQLRHVFTMFADISHKIPFNISQITNGVAMADVDNDGDLEWIISGYNGANLVLKYKDGEYINLALPSSPYENLRDVSGAGRGVCACDIDGDGREEIYILNTNHQYSGPKTYTDRLFKWRNHKYVDLLSDQVNIGLPMFAGRSVACLDRDGDGKYGFLLTTYADGGRGTFRLIEMDSKHPSNKVANGAIVLIDVSASVGIGLTNGGQGIAVGPIFDDNGRSDIFITNEGNTRLDNLGNNNLFRGISSTLFTDVSTDIVADINQDGRGVAIDDLNQDGLIDIIYGNWLGPHRILLQQRNSTGHVRFHNVENTEFARSSPITSVLTADFDNDGDLEIFIGNQYHVPDYTAKDALISTNRLFTTNSKTNELNLESVAMGQAMETLDSVTGSSVADIDGDGILELITCHTGPSLTKSVRIYHVKDFFQNFWLRVMPLTQFGAPARGAIVTLTLNDMSKIKRIVDSGSGYMSQMEPVAHFGLGKNLPKFIKIVWPNGHAIRRSLNSEEVNIVFTIKYNGIMILKRNTNYANSPIQISGASCFYNQLKLIIYGMSILTVIYYKYFN